MIRNLSRSHSPYKIPKYVDDVSVFKTFQENIERLAKVLIREAEWMYLQMNEDIKKYDTTSKKSSKRLCVDRKLFKDTKIPKKSQIKSVKF